MSNTLIPHASKPDSEPSPPRRSLPEQPAFYLIYLIFYFTPWFFERPPLADGLIGLAAVLSFIPVYLYAMAGEPYRTGVPLHRILIGAGYASFLAIALAPLHGMSGNFHIFAITLLAALQPRTRALIAMAGLSVFYLSVSYVMNVTVFEMTLSQFIGIMAGLATLAGYDTAHKTTMRERSLRLEAELAALQERERIARDLHDVLGHTLTTIAVKSELAAKLIDADSVRARSEITDIRDAARATLKDVRAAVAGMHVTTLDQEVDRAQSALAAADIQLTSTGSAPVFTPAAQSALGLALREAVTNIIRHSGASKAQLHLEETGFEIADNGRGGVLEGGTGLEGMRRRIEELGGTMTANSCTTGVRLHFSLPVSHHQQTSQLESDT